MDLKGKDILEVVDEWLRENPDKSEFSIVRSFVSRYCIPYWIFKSEILGHLKVDEMRLKEEDLADELWGAIFSVLDKNIKYYVDPDNDYSMTNIVDEMVKDFDLYTTCTDYTLILKAVQRLRLEEPVSLTKHEYDGLIKIADENGIDTIYLKDERSRL
ncbi:MAG: hypothetical protein PQJ59_13840 [Spirochaetales bacterium]|nr:hypothetical protein [Spirochaetales bacterium]